MFWFSISARSLSVSSGSYGSIFSERSLNARIRKNNYKKMSYKQIQEEVNSLKSDVEAFNRIHQLNFRASSDGTERIVVSVPDGSGGYDEEQMDAPTFFKGRWREITADSDLALTDRNASISANGESITLTIPDDLGWAKGAVCYVVQRGTSFSIDHTAVTAEIPQTLTDTENSIYRIEKVDRVSDTDVYNITQIGTAAQVTNAFDKTADDLDDITEGTTNKHFTATDETKLNGIAAGAEVNTTNSITTGEPTGSDQVLNKVSLTQAEYDAGTPLATTLYYITDA